MRLVLQKHGGIVGAPRPPEIVDTQAMAAEDAARLRALVQSLELGSEPAVFASTPPAVDSLGYDLTIHHDDGRVSNVSFDEKAAPAALKELKHRIRAFSRPP